MPNGFVNENEIVYEFSNNKNYEELNQNLQNVLLTVNNNIIPNSYKVRKIGGANKADFSILLDDKEIYISIKKGSGNSLHQESIEDFISFLDNFIESDESVFNDLRFYIWGDGSLNGVAPIVNRMSASELKIKFPSLIQNIQLYFNKHQNELARRFIVDGAVSKNKADYLLYGDKMNCSIVAENKILEYVKSKEKKPLSIGILTFQAWNRNLSGIPNKENRRGQIQIKWGTLENDLKQII